MNEEPIRMKVIAVRNLLKSWTLERVPKPHWSCSVTLERQGGLHKPATLDMSHHDVEKVPELGDVLLIMKPKVVGYASPENSSIKEF